MRGLVFKLSTNFFAVMAHAKIEGVNSPDGLRWCGWC